VRSIWLVVDQPAQAAMASGDDDEQLDVLAERGEFERLGGSAACFLNRVAKEVCRSAQASSGGNAG
jgi:hypothetical protein